MIVFSSGHLQALSSLPGWLSELLRSVHVHSLKSDEVLLLKDPRRLVEHRDAELQVSKNNTSPIVSKSAHALPPPDCLSAP